MTVQSKGNLRTCKKCGGLTVHTNNICSNCEVLDN